MKKLIFAILLLAVQTQLAMSNNPNDIENVIVWDCSVNIMNKGYALGSEDCHEYSGVHSPESYLRRRLKYDFEIIGVTLKETQRSGFWVNNRKVWPVYHIQIRRKAL